MDVLKEDNERLRRRKDELEMLFEHSNMKDAYNIPKYKVNESICHGTLTATDAHSNVLF